MVLSGAFKKEFPYRKCTGERQKELSFKLLLRYINEYIYPYSPYYRKLFKENKINPGNIKTYNDFMNIPFTIKEDTVKDPRSFILQPSIAGQESAYDTAPLSRGKMIQYIIKTLGAQYTRDKYGPRRSFKEKVRQTALEEWFPVHFQASGGTTGISSTAVYTYQEIIPGGAFLNASGSYNFVKNIGPGKRFLNIMPGVPHLGYYQAFLGTLLGGYSIFNTFGGAGIPTERQVEIASKGGFDAMVGITSYIYYWLDVANKLIKAGKVPPITSFATCFCAGEPMNAEYTSRLKDMFAGIGCSNVDIIEVYGSTELKLAFYECVSGSKPHVSPDYFFIECLDPETRKPVKEGEPGVLVFSHIGWRGTVFLRYWTGDLLRGGIIWNECPNCKLTIPRLNTPIVRAGRDFTKIKGARVPYLKLQDAVRHIPGVDLFHVLITKAQLDDPLSRDIVKIYVAKTENVSEEKIREEITKSMKMETEISPSEIIFEDYDLIKSRLFARTGIKADWVIDERQSV